MDHALNVAALIITNPILSPVMTLGFYGPADGGHALYYWDSAKKKTKHDGGSVIDPDIGVLPGSTGWYVSTNDGYGCWVAIESERVSILQYGARNGYDSTLAMLYCGWHCQGVGTGKILQLPAGTFGFSEQTAGYGWYINEPLKIDAAGTERTILKNLSPTGRMLYGAAGNIDISNLTIDNNWSTGSAFRQGGQYSSTKNLIIKNQAGPSYAMELDGSTLASLENIVMYNVFNGVDIGAVSPTNYVRMEQFAIGQTGGKALRVNRGANIRIDGLTIEPNFETSLNHDHLIDIANSSHVDIGGLTYEDSATSTTQNPEYIRVQDSRRVNFTSARISHRGSSGKAIFGLYGAGTSGVSVEKTLWLEERSAMALVRNNTGGVSNVSIRDITTENAQAAQIIDCVSQVVGLTIGEVSDFGASTTAKLSGTDLNISNFSGAMEITDGARHTFTNCTGPFTGNGAPEGSFIGTCTGPIATTCNISYKKSNGLVTLYIPTTITAGTGASGPIYISGMPSNLYPKSGNILAVGLVKNAGVDISGGSAEIDTVGNIVISANNGQVFQGSTDQTGFYRHTITYMSAH